MCKAENLVARKLTEKELEKELKLLGVMTKDFLELLQDPDYGNVINAMRFLPHYLTDTYCGPSHAERSRNFLRRTGMTLLMAACRNGKQDVVQAIMMNVGRGVCPDLNINTMLNRQDTAGWTALHWASYYDHLNCCKTLTRAGASSTICSSDKPKGYPPWCLSLQGKTALEMYGAGHDPYTLYTRPLGDVVKNERRSVLLKCIAKALIRKREANWERRGNFVFFLASWGYRPLAVRLLELHLAALAVDASLPPIDRSTREANRQYLLGCVLSNDGLVRLMVAFL